MATDGYGIDDYDSDIEESLVIKISTREDVDNFPLLVEARPDALEVELDCNIDFMQDPPLFDVISVSPGENPYGEGVYSYAIAEDAVRFDLSRIPDLLPDIRSLNLECNGLNGSFPSLLTLTKIENLNLSNNQFLNLKLQDLPRAFPNLKWLDLYMCDGVTGDVKMLAPFRNQLRKLVLGGCYQVTGSVLDLAGFPNLHSLSIGETKIKGTEEDMEIAGIGDHFRRLSYGGREEDGQPGPYSSEDVQFNHMTAE